MKSAVQFRAAALVCLALLSTNALAQQPVGAEAPLTPEQQREKDIQEADPVYRKENAEKEKAAREAAKRRELEQAVPGSIAADNQPALQRSGPAVEEDSSANLVPQYNGPAVLSRTYSIGQPILPKDLKWSESFTAGTSYDTGLGQINANGSPGSGGALQGTQISWSFSGGHAFAHNQVSFSYTGVESYYPGSAFYTGINQSMAAQLSHMISRRLQLGISVTGSDTSANAALQNPVIGPATIANMNLATSPGLAVLDTGSKQYSAQANLNWKITGRLSAGFNASSFAVERNSAALYGVSGISTGSNITYRLTRKMTIGGSYSYSQYVFPHGAGSSDTQSAGGIFSYALNNSTQIRLNAGLSRVEDLGLQTVPLSPIIAALLGQTTGIIDAYQTYRSTNISAQAIKDFHKSRTMSFAYARGVTPGNGVFQTSQQESFALNAGVRILRTYGLSFGAGRDKLISLMQNLGPYASEYAVVSVARSYKTGMGVNFSVNYRHFEIASLSSLRNQLTISSGFSWSSARLWPF